MKVDLDLGYSTEWIQVSLLVSEFAVQAQDVSLVSSYLLSFSMKMEWCADEAHTSGWLLGCHSWFLSWVTSLHLSISFCLSSPKSTESYFQLGNEELWARDASCRTRKPPVPSSAGPGLDYERREAIKESEWSLAEKKVPIWALKLLQLQQTWKSYRRTAL